MRSTSAGKFIRLARLRKLCACDQVAAVCYRVRSGQIEFLLIRTRAGKRWTFPKGSAERGLTHAQAAALEAFEEAGVHGRIEEAMFACYRRLDRDQSSAGRSSADGSIHAHLCEVVRLSAPKESGRERTWFTTDQAKGRLCEGRTAKQASEFIRVVNRAAERIEQLLHSVHVADKDVRVTHSVHAAPYFADRSLRTKRADALQEVKFDFAEVCAGAQSVSVKTDNGRSNAGLNRSMLPRARQRENVACEILKFESQGRLKLPN